MADEVEDPIEEEKIKKKKFTTSSVNYTMLNRMTGGDNEGAGISDLVGGKDLFNKRSVAQTNRDATGVLFITKPDFNLRRGNIESSLNRLMASLIDDGNPNSVASLVRYSLDSRLAKEVLKGPNKDQFLIDPNNPFIHILDNSIVSCEGWLDYGLETWVSPPGGRNESIIEPKGVINKRTKYELNMNHRNFRGNVIPYLYQVWLEYMEAVKVTGTMIPYWNNLAENRYDFQSRIYRFVLDDLSNTITDFTMTTAGFPTKTNNGAVYNYNVDDALNAGVDEVQQTWSCVGSWHKDPIVIREFNKTVINANPDLAGVYDVLSLDLKRNADGFVGNEEYVGFEEKEFWKLFNYKSVPLINPGSMKFVLMVNKKIAKKMLSEVMDTFGTIDDLGASSGGMKNLKDLINFRYSVILEG